LHGLRNQESNGGRLFNFNVSKAEQTERPYQPKRGTRGALTTSSFSFRREWPDPGKDPLVSVFPRIGGEAQKKEIPGIQKNRNR